jgi:hypothetical protein
MASLSKRFAICEQTRIFFGDIDSSFARGFLGYGGASEPEAGVSNKEKQRRVKALMAACQHRIATELMPALNSSIKAKISRIDHWSLRPDEPDPDKQTLLFAYPSSLPPTESGHVQHPAKPVLKRRGNAH